MLDRSTAYVYAGEDVELCSVRSPINSFVGPVDI